MVLIYCTMSNYIYLSKRSITLGQMPPTFCSHQHSETQTPDLSLSERVAPSWSTMPTISQSILHSCSSKVLPTQILRSNQLWRNSTENRHFPLYIFGNPKDQSAKDLLEHAPTFFGMFLVWWLFCARYKRVIYAEFVKLTSSWLSDVSSSLLEKICPRHCMMREIVNLSSDWTDPFLMYNNKEPANTTNDIAMHIKIQLAWGLHL